MDMTLEEYDEYVVSLVEQMTNQLVEECEYFDYEFFLTENEMTEYE